MVVFFSGQILISTIRLMNDPPGSTTMNRTNTPTMLVTFVVPCFIYVTMQRKKIKLAAYLLQNQQNRYINLSTPRSVVLSFEPISLEKHRTQARREGKSAHRVGTTMA
jgi:hypothetical protein